MKKVDRKYKLRYLFYRKQKGFTIISNNIWYSEYLCKNCKSPASHYIAWLDTQSKTSKIICLYCSKDLIKIPNKSISKKLFALYTFLLKYIWNFLDFIHILRRYSYSRYGICGDESKYANAEFDLEWNFVGYKYKKRKWWEYIIIKN